MRDIVDTKDPVILLVDRKLREEYDDCWNRYVSTVLTGGTPEQRQYAYQRASNVEQRFGKAKDLASARHKKLTAIAAIDKAKTLAAADERPEP